MFDSHYETILADTEDGRALHRKIRYHVYCLERRFEDPAVFPNGEEYDVWDIHAAHFMVRHRATATWVAAARLVLPETFQFPVETLHCLAPEPAQRPPRCERAEISRICIINTPAPWRINAHLDYGFGHVGRSSESGILLGIFRALMIYSLRRDIEHCYLLVSHAFARLLKRLGFILHTVGEEIEHRGSRIPYQIRLRETAKSLIAQSTQFRAMFNQRDLAYQSFSTLDSADHEDFKLMPSRFGSPLTRETTRRSEISLPTPNHPGVWRMEAEYSRPGPGAWRNMA